MSLDKWEYFSVSLNNLIFNTINKFISQNNIMDTSRAVLYVERK